MTLYHFFKDAGLSVQKKEACKLGEELSATYLLKFQERPPKVSIQEIDHPINDYPEDFLTSRVDYIIQFLTEKYSVNG